MIDIKNDYNSKTTSNNIIQGHNDVENQNNLSHFELPQDIASVLMFCPTENIYMKQKTMEHDFKSKLGVFLFKNLR